MKGRSVASGDAETLPLFQQSFRGNPLGGDVAANRLERGRSVS